MGVLADAVNQVVELPARRHRAAAVVRHAASAWTTCAAWASWASEFVLVLDTDRVLSAGELADVASAPRGGAAFRTPRRRPAPPRREDARDASRSLRRRGAAPSTGSSASVPISEREFALFQTLIQREAGIHLAPAKKALLVGRLARRLRELGLAVVRRLLRAASSSRTTATERLRMLDRICTNETHFFREPRHFEFLERRASFPAWRRGRGRRRARVRVWSAACSTGEEPYSLAMVLLAPLPAGPGWDVEILATDLSTRVAGEGARRASGRSTRPRRSRALPARPSCSAATGSAGRAR